MAVGIRLIALPLLALMACSPSGHAQSEGEALAASGETAENDVGLQSARVGGTEFELVSLGRTCAVRYGEAQIVLELPPPCRFLSRGDTGTATVEDYGDEGMVTLVAGPLAASADYALSEDRVLDDRCSHVAQPLFVKDDELSIGKLLVSALGYCSTAAPDEKFYYGLAHPEG